ncbi:hypothetical protein B0H17DRAFT_1153500 [Mycena rosella]|uniref:Uncharacterized protein n=1 Tax=Mycena rosella TaxID=1033263 RepID=A0AAD7FA06_MYCRO|nr:hypothetical protein B0H17DRAFT_1153500 [Mycena rosella]
MAYLEEMIQDCERSGTMTRSKSQWVCEIRPRREGRSAVGQYALDAEERWRDLKRQNLRNKGQALSCCVSVETEIARAVWDEVGTVSSGMKGSFGAMTVRSRMVRHREPENVVQPTLKARRTDIGIKKLGIKRLVSWAEIQVRLQAQSRIRTSSLRNQRFTAFSTVIDQSWSSCAELPARSVEVWLCVATRLAQPGDGRLVTARSIFVEACDTRLDWAGGGG